VVHRRQPGAIVPDAPTADGWLSLAEAAQQLGISVDAVRRRLRRGEYPRRQMRTRHGLIWQVQLVPADPGATLVASLVPVVESSVEPTVAALLAYLREPALTGATPAQPSR